MTHGWPWRVDHMIMISVTWLHFDQSANLLVVGHTTVKYDEPEVENEVENVENVARGLRPRVTFSTSGSSYLDVGLTTVHHLYIVNGYNRRTAIDCSVVKGSDRRTCVLLHVYRRLCCNAEPVAYLKPFRSTLP